MRARDRGTTTVHSKENLWRKKYVLSMDGFNFRGILGSNCAE